jgi:hypothetical protein
MQIIAFHTQLRKGHEHFIQPMVIPAHASSHHSTRFTGFGFDMDQAESFGRIVARRFQGMKSG